MSAQKDTHAEAFNEVCEALNKVYNVQRSDWDLHVPAILWAYRATCKKLMDQTPSSLAYGANTAVPIEQSIPSPRIAASIDMTVHRALEEGIT